MLSRNQVLKLFNSYDLDPKTAMHCHLVNQFANDLAWRIKIKHPKLKLNLDDVDLASIFHDVSKGEGRSHHNHPYNAFLISKKLGHPKKVAQIILKHTPKSVLSDPPSSLEEKIVFYADRRYDKDRFVTVRERMKGYFKKYPEMTEKKKVLKKVLEIEGELLNLAKA